MAIASVINIIGDYVLVLKLGMGVAGAAWATVACQYVAAACLMRVLVKKRLLSFSSFFSMPAVKVRSALQNPSSVLNPFESV